MKNIAIITARGGSKRIPRKNIRDFMGKPILAYAIEAALKTGLFDEVMVSTDDAEIVQIAEKYGAKIPFMRSAKTSDDYATTADVLLEVLAMYRDRGVTFDELCCIYPCVPLLTCETLVRAYHEFAGHDALVPVCRYSTPIEWAMIVENGFLLAGDVQTTKIRSQDMVPKYHDVGMFYFSTTASLESTRMIIPPKSRAFFMDETECQDIDTPDDWRIAELKYRMIYGT